VADVEGEYWRTCATCGKETGYLFWSEYCDDCRDASIVKPLAYRKDPGEIRMLASQVYRGEVFFRWMSEDQVGDIKSAWSMMFAFDDGTIFTTDRLKDVGAFYAPISSAGPLAVNGMPMFTSVQFLHREDAPEFDRVMREIVAFMEPATTGEQ
jgi:hypothetical protein